MRRLSLFAAIGAAFVLTGTSALAGGPVDGTSAGREIGSPNASATCNPFAATKPSDYFCRFQVHGSYFDDNPILGDGTYTGTIIQNWGNGGPTPNNNYNSELCIPVSGTIVFKRTGKTGTLTVTLVANPTPYDPLNGFYSMACINQGGVEGGGGELDLHYMEDVTGTTGYFHTAVKNPSTSDITMNGNSFPSGTHAQNSVDSSYLGVNLS